MKEFDLFQNTDPVYGSLVPIECGIGEVFFPINRVYYIYGVPQNTRRGFHAHRKLHQVLICTSGSVKIWLKTPFEEQTILLDRPTKALYVGQMVWREMFDFSTDAVLMVLASDHYDATDYLRNYDAYYYEALALGM